jgi:hypothetical protein
MIPSRFGAFVMATMIPWDDECSGSRGRLYYYDCNRSISNRADVLAIYIYAYGEFRIQCSLSVSCGTQGRGGVCHAESKWPTLCTLALPHVKLRVMGASFGANRMIMSITVIVLMFLCQLSWQWMRKDLGQRRFESSICTPELPRLRIREWRSAIDT